MSDKNKAIFNDSHNAFTDLVRYEGVGWLQFQYDCGDKGSTEDLSKR